MGTPAPVLEIDHARIAYRLQAGDLTVVPDLSLSIAPGEALGLVGESGCGKSTVALAVMGYLGRVGTLAAGRILVDGTDIATLAPEALRRLRGGRMAMVYQDPMSSLNPTMKVGRQLVEVAEAHGLATNARTRALELLREVRLPEPEAMLDRYPHQLSGGQQQRVVIAMALMADPALLVMDEPTTGLDVTVEAAVLDLVAELRRKHGMALLFISHNLGAVLRVCDRVGVMYAGEIVEQGPIAEVFRHPLHPYTRGLLGAIPSLSGGSGARLAPIRGQVASLLDRVPGCGFAARCMHATEACRKGPVPLEALAPDHAVRCIHASALPPWQRGGGEAPRAMPEAAAPIVVAKQLRKAYVRSGLFGGRGRATLAVDGITLAAPRGQTLAIVGESGCGKSTFAKLLTGLESADEGALSLDGTDVAQAPVERRPPDLTRRVQMVFQNPDGTLNPSHSIGYAIGRAVRRLRGAADPEVEVQRLLELVRLSPEMAHRKPRQLSGGQKQRVAIARALAGEPELLVADEPVSALDMSVQAAIVNLILDLQQARGLSLVFISHDLAVVRFLADQVAVMYRGRIVECGSVAQVFGGTNHPYTQALLSAAPDPDPDRQEARIALAQRPVPTGGAAGCVFAPACPRHLGAVCDEVPPPEQMEAGHRIACHIPRAALAHSA